MTANNAKDIVQYTVATITALSGLAMCWYSKVTSGTIEGNDLGYLGECLAWSGAIFGIGIYAKVKISQAAEEIERKFFSKYGTNKENNNEEVGNDEEGND